MKANTYRQSLQTVLAHCPELPAETAPFARLLGRILAHEIRAAADDPPAPKSAMDGFAVYSGDTRGATPGNPATFTYAEAVGAGHVPQGRVGRGAAIRLMTGALLPEGADAVVKLEDTRSEGTGRFTLTRALAPGENVVPRGANLRSGTVLLKPGSCITPGALGVVATQGLGSLGVHRRPRVGLLALGDELKEVGTPLQPGQLYVSNLYTLEALADRYGAETVRLGVAGDDPEVIEGRLRSCLPETNGEAPCDVLITVGGSHDGDYDFVDTVLARLGARLHFRRTLINAGGSTLFATRGETLFFGLPGTPAASWLAFELLARPALLRLGGGPMERPVLQARLTQAASVRPGRTHFIPARLGFPQGHTPEVTLYIGAQARARPPGLLINGLVHWPEGVEILEAGHTVPVEWLGE